MVKNDERQFESDSEASMTGELGWQKATYTFEEMRSRNG